MATEKIKTKGSEPKKTGAKPETKPEKKSFFQDATAKFKKLSPAAKAGLVALGLLAAYLIFRSFSSSRNSSGGNAVVYYPDGSGSGSGGSLDTSSGGSSNYLPGGGGGGISGGGSQGTQNTNQKAPQYLTEDTFTSFADQIINKIGDRGDVTVPAGTSNVVDFNSGKRSDTYHEAGINYTRVQYDEGPTEIYKDGRLIPESSYNYIPSVIGGTRDNNIAAPKVSNAPANSSFSGLDYELQQAQLAWGAANAANDRAGMDAAAALGQKLRAEGATDSGAAAAWDHFNGLQ